MVQLELHRRQEAEARVRAQDTFQSPGQPLFDRPRTDTLYFGNKGPVSVAEAEQRIRRLEQRLPATRYILNLCTDRHHFLVAFAAVLSSGRINLLPPNAQPETVAELLDRYEDVGVVHDSMPSAFVPGYSVVNVRDAANEQIPESTACLDEGDDRPVAHRDAIAAISFTSGSTGLPRANEKTWGMLVDGTDINLAAVLGDRPEHVSMLATVPPQHMYGLELSVLMPMRARISVHAGQPLYPADVITALNDMPTPRALVTTPAHLRTLLGSGEALPATQHIFSATAPLEADMASRAESAFAGTLTEIYGCSEVGSIARRVTARESDWQVFDGLSLVETINIDSRTTDVRIVAAHLTEAAELQDSIELVAPNRFHLRGRRDDLINIAGKRGSLAEVNRRLIAVPGVVDGVAFQPSDGRLAAIVVAPDLDRSQLINALRQVLDPVFLPRPILFVDRLPRQGSSKLRRSDLMALLDAHRHSGSASAEA